MWPLIYSPLSGKWPFLNLITCLYKSFPNSPCMYDSPLNYTTIITKKSIHIKYYYLFCFSSNNWLATMVQYPTQQSKSSIMKHTTMNRAQGWLSDSRRQSDTHLKSKSHVCLCVCSWGMNRADWERKRSMESESEWPPTPGNPAWVSCYWIISVIHLRSGVEVLRLSFWSTTRDYTVTTYYIEYHPWRDS